MPSVGINQGPSSNADAGISSSISPTNINNNNNISSSSKATVNVILNNVAPPVPTVVTASAASSATGYKQQGISSTVTVNSTAPGKYFSFNSDKLAHVLLIFHRIIDENGFENIDFCISTSRETIVGIGRLETLQVNEDSATSSTTFMWWKTIQKYFVKKESDGNFSVYLLLCIGVKKKRWSCTV